VTVYKNIVIYHHLLSFTDIIDLDSMNEKNKKNGKNENKKMYYGMGPVPKGKIRASAEHCVRANQIRYYGIKAIDKNLLKQSKHIAPNLLKEQLKLKQIENRATILLNDYKLVKLVLAKENVSSAKQIVAEKKN